MRQSGLLLNTLRESPGDAETASHRLLLRGGFIRQLAAGIYTYLPLGRRVLRKAEQIVREEMDRAGGQEVLMPAMQPAELWRESGRYEVYGPELIRLADRHGREFALGPTHEEVITSLVKQEINSYRQLPMTLYQIQTKYRDERRPRFGLLRGREFLMKDAYSFDADWEGLDRSYRAMFAAYHRIFQRCGLEFRAVEADAGAIGGEGGTHEFMALADIGEDTIVACTCCDYAANLEKAEAREGQAVKGGEEQTEHSAAFSASGRPGMEKFHTPGVKTISQLEDSLGVRPSDIMKTVVFMADGEPVAVAIRGDREINELKVKNALGAEICEPADPDAVEALTGVPVGSVGPHGLRIRVLFDSTAAEMEEAIIGANERDYHFRHVVPERDLTISQVGDFRNVQEGEACPRCAEGTLKYYRGIELGHVFKLGTKYSEKLGAEFLDVSGKSQPVIMGCYGIGVSRVLSAVIEQNHDEYGIIWPASLAPFLVHLVPVSIKDEAQKRVAEEIYERLTEFGVEVLLDDRDERAGVKFKDADLIGLPFRIVIGKGAGEGWVEFVERRSPGVKTQLTVEEAIHRVLEMRGEANDRRLK